MLEVIYCDQTIPRDSDEFKAFEVYLKRIWFSSGIYHHYGCEKFKPAFSSAWLRQQLEQVDAVKLPLREGKRVNKADGEDLLLTSACHFYDGVTQEEAETFYNQLKQENADSPTPVSYGLNSTLVKEDGEVREQVWSANGKYANAIRHIIYWLEKAETVAENDQQKKVIRLLINYYESGDLQIFNKYCIEWLQEHDSAIDFINGFIEVYGDPLGLKGSWEGLVEYIDEEATKRTQTISRNATSILLRPSASICLMPTGFVPSMAQRVSRSAISPMLTTRLLMAMASRKSSSSIRRRSVSSRNTAISATICIPICMNASDMAADSCCLALTLMR